MKIYIQSNSNESCKRKLDSNINSPKESHTLLQAGMMVSQSSAFLLSKV